MEQRPGQEHLHVEAGRALINILKDAKHTRLLVVGGAGSLFVDEAKTTRLMDTPEFPKEYLPTASNQGENLKDLQQTDSISWTFLSPAAFLIQQENGLALTKKEKTMSS